MLSPSVVSTFLSAVSGNCHTVLAVRFVLVATSHAMQALAAYKCALEMVNCITYIGRGSVKFSGVDHWSVVMLSMAMLLRRVRPSSHCPPATTTRFRQVARPGQILLVGIGGSSWCHTCPDQALTRLVTVWDDDSLPPMSTKWPLISTP